MASLIKPPEKSIRDLIRCFVKSIAKAQKVRVTINVYWHEGKYFTEEFDGRKGNETHSCRFNKAVG